MLTDVQSPFLGTPLVPLKGRGRRSPNWSDVLFFPPRRGGARHEQTCDFGIMGMWYSRVPQNHHDLHPLLGWKDMHILIGGSPDLALEGARGEAVANVRCYSVQFAAVVP